MLPLALEEQKLIHSDHSHRIKRGSGAYCGGTTSTIRAPIDGDVLHRQLTLFPPVITIGVLFSVDSPRKGVYTPQLRPQDACSMFRLRFGETEVMAIMGVGYQPTTMDISPTSPKRLTLERLWGY